MECKHRNGEITGYTVRYEVLGSGDQKFQQASGTQTVIQDLMASTTYSIEVAAQNSAGTGVYSPTLLTTMHGSEFILNYDRAVYHLPTSPISRCLYQSEW